MIVIKNILILLADWANGIFALLIASYFTQYEIALWHVPIAMLVSMLPDLDAVPELFQRGVVAASKENPTDHRDILHVPIVYLLIGIITWYMFEYWGAVFLFATMLHFFNDMYGTGWGVSIFAPFSKDRYKFFTNLENDFSLLPRNFIRIIPRATLVENITEYGNENWAEDVYLHITPISAIEYSLFLLAVSLLLIKLL